MTEESRKTDTGRVRIKLCGMMREADIEAVNAIRPEYIGFVFAKKSRRYVTPERAAALKSLLTGKTEAVGVFTDEDPNTVASLLKEGIIDLAQLHGSEDEDYIRQLRSLTDKPLIRAFRITGPEDVKKALQSSADHILLDAGAGDGRTFDWSLLRGVDRPYFLAGGLDPENAAGAAEALHPFALDVSSGIETEGVKDPEKMRLFAERVRSAYMGK